MYVPTSIMEYLRKNYVCEKRMFFFENTGEHYPFYNTKIGCEKYMQKLTDTVINVAKEHSVEYPKEWDTIIPFSYFGEKYKNYDAAFYCGKGVTVNDNKRSEDRLYQGSAC